MGNVVHPKDSQTLDCCISFARVACYYIQYMHYINTLHYFILGCIVKNHIRITLHYNTLHWITLHSTACQTALTPSFAQEYKGHNMCIYLKISINTCWSAQHDHICWEIDHNIRIKIQMRGKCIYHFWIHIIPCGASVLFSQPTN